MQLTYLLLFPINKDLNEGERIRLKGLKRGPYFLDIDISIQALKKKEIEIAGIKILQESFVYDNFVRLFQFSYDAGEILEENLLELKNKINSEIRKNTLSEYGAGNELVEEYSMLLIKKSSQLKAFVDKNMFILARFIRSVSKKIGEEDAAEILSSRAQYSKEDLVVVDWEGAVIIDGDGDFESQLELLRIGNYQLLRYRVLDKLISDSLNMVRESINNKSKKFLGTGVIRNTLENKLSLLLDFDKVDQSILLVGDWYSSKLYKIIMEEFYIDDWRSMIKNKLENLEAIDSTAQEKLAFSWERTLDMVQIVGWLLLLVGYFFLYFKEAHLI